jgi:hypothetical protein
MVTGGLLTFRDINSIELDIAYATTRAFPTDARIRKLQLARRAIPTEW